MKLFISFSFNEEYLPTPRCKKVRVREVASSTSVTIKECTKEDAPLVMLVKRYECEDCEIRVFKGKLYRNVQRRDMNRVDDSEEPLEQNETVKTIDWQTTIWGHTYYNDCRWNGTTGDVSSKAKIKKNASKYLVIDDMVFMRTTEPVYNITCFGLMDSAGMFIEWKDKYSTQKSCYSAMEREECHNALKRILSCCREKYDNSNSYVIKVLAPEYVKFKRLTHKK